MKVLDLLPLHLEEIAYLGFSTKTAENAECAVRSFVSVTKNMGVEDITYLDIQKWALFLRKERSQSTVRGYVIKMRRFLQFAHNRGFNVIDYQSIQVPKRPKATPQWLEPNDIEKLIDACDCRIRFLRVRAKLILSLLYGSGLRVSELCDLKRDVFVGNSFFVIGKGSEPRPCFVDQRTSEYLNEWLKIREFGYGNVKPDTNPYLFVNMDNRKPINKDVVGDIMRNLADKTGIKVTAHVLRHSFATNLLRNNTNLRYVQAFLGHKSIQTTEIYTHYIDEDLKKIYFEKHTI